MSARRRIAAVVATLVVGLLGATVFAYFKFQQTSTETIDEHFYAVWGGGGDSTILLAEAGALVVDTKFLRPGWRLASTVQALAHKPVKVIINTHYHRDHTHGNSNYERGTQVIAQRRTRAHLIEFDKRFWEVGPAWSLLPQDLVDEAKELAWGDETIRILYLGRGHTDGDVVVHFVKRRLLQTGDLFVNGVYPRIDRKGGGSVREWLATLDRILAIEDVERYIPGHGPMAEREQVERFRGYLQSLVDQVQALAKEGKSLQEVEARVDLSDYDDWRGIPFFTSRAKNIASVYEELKSQQAERNP